MGRYIRWQAILTLTGIAMIMAFLSFLALSRTTIVIQDKGGIYTEGIVGMPRFVNPLLAQYNQVDQDLGALIFNGLTRMDGNGKLEPDLAASWTVSDDGLTYQFKLRRNITWQDGEPFSADDVLFTIGLMQDPEFPGAPYLHQLWKSVTVDKVDDYTLSFTLSEPFPAFTEFTTIGMLPEALLKPNACSDLLNHPFNLQPVGTGPFKLQAITAQAARLSNNPFYTQATSQLGGLELHFYPAYQDMITAYENGEIQGISQVTPHQLPWAQSLESLNLYTARLSGYNIIYLNLQAPDTSPFFQEKAARQALLAALDQQAIINHALHGQGLAANSPILSWNWAYNPEQPTYAFNLVRANNLLDEAGWVDTDDDGIRDNQGQPLAFNLLTSNDPTNIRIAETVRDQWQQIGVSTTVEVVGEGLNERLVEHNFQAALAQVLLAGDPDPYPFWHNSQIAGGQNYAGWDNAKASKLLEDARTTTDRGLRNDYYYEFQEIFAEEVPSLILFHPVYTYGISRGVFDVQLAPMTNPSNRFNTVSNWYMLTRQVVFDKSQVQ